MRAAPPGTTMTMTGEVMDLHCDDEDRQWRRVEEAYQWARYMSLSHLGNCLCSDPELCRAMLMMLGGEISVADDDNDDSYDNNEDDDNDYDDDDDDNDDNDKNDDNNYNNDDNNDNDNDNDDNDDNDNDDDNDDNDNNNDNNKGEQ
jgi:hypothetical protein